MTPSPLESNQLAKASSPYLRQHADNPVNWQEWNDTTLKLAKELDRPILLSIGYAACHWCHVMAHESFEDPATAQLMNELFINIKVDREERPDIDQIYMAALHAMGEQGGWPLTIFLTPKTDPYWGGTYFPPTPSHGRPAFSQVLRALADAYVTQSESVIKNSTALTSHLTKLSIPPTQKPELSKNIVYDFQQKALSLFDPANGGIKGAPKFPNAPILENWARASGGDAQSDFGKAFLRTIERISNGGIYDHLAGGIARYSVDESWLVPHFEKMLYDNAHYLRHLVLAWKMTGQNIFRFRIEETIAWLLDEMLLPSGAFASSMDADSEGVEGKYYVWTAEELQEAIPENHDLFASTYGVREGGNWEGTNILNRLDSSEYLGDDDEGILGKIRSKLLILRKKRVPPEQDDKVLTDWNSYLIRAFCEAGQVLERRDWIAIGATAYRSITESNSPNEQLCHSKRNGQVGSPVNASDLGGLINASISLYETTADKEYLTNAKQYLTLLEEEFSDGEGGFFLTSANVSDLLIRPRCDQDEANPSGSSQILESMVRYGNLAGDTEVLDKAENLAINQLAISKTNPYGMAGFMAALHSWFEHKHVQLHGDIASTNQFLNELKNIPDLALTTSVGEIPESSIYDFSEVKHTAFAVVCSGRSCSAPLTTAEALGEYLTSSRTD